MSDKIMSPASNDVFHPTEARSKMCPYLGKECLANRCMKWKWYTTHTVGRPYDEAKRTEYGYCGA